MSELEVFDAIKIIVVIINHKLKTNRKRRVQTSVVNIGLKNYLEITQNICKLENKQKP